MVWEITFSMLLLTHVRFYTYFVQVYGNAWLFSILDGDSGSHIPEVGVQSSQRGLDYDEKICFS